jgi:hypothetical protein
MGDHIRLVAEQAGFWLAVLGWFAPARLLKRASRREWQKPFSFF